MQSAGGYGLTRVRNSTLRENRETVKEDSEQNKALNQANAINSNYFTSPQEFMVFQINGKRARSSGA
jgi:hypothetical protein